MNWSTTKKDWQNQSPKTKPTAGTTCSDQHSNHHLRLLSLLIMGNQSQYSSQIAAESFPANSQKFGDFRWSVNIDTECLSYGVGLSVIWRYLRRAPVGM